LTERDKYEPSWGPNMAENRYKWRNVGKNSEKFIIFIDNPQNLNKIHVQILDIIKYDCKITNTRKVSVRILEMSAGSSNPNDNFRFGGGISLD
jgi:hypothetical protein